MSENHNGFAGFLLVVIIVMGIFLWQQNKQIGALNDALSEANGNIDSLNSEIGQANDDLDNLNSQIDDAQSMAWSDYETMGSTLENLSAVEDTFETYDTVSNPTK
jgi:peptidoglycan hydrolase CwlO-like protein